MSRRVLPFEVAVTTPCRQAWREMQGSASQRHCAACDRDVLNFAAMTPRQIERAAALSGGHLCARISRREDGSLVTLPEPVRGRAAGFVLAAALAAVPITSWAQAGALPQASSPQPDQLENKPDSATKITHTAVTGVITDSQGALVVGCDVTLMLQGALVGSTKTNEAGEFAFVVVPGDYQLEVAAPGFSPSSRPLAVGTQDATVGDIALKPGSQVTTIQVTAALSIVSTTMGAMVAVVDARWYKRWGYRARHPIAYTKYLFRHR